MIHHITQQSLQNHYTAQATMNASKCTRWNNICLSGSLLTYLLPHVDEEELPGNIEGHIGIIGIIPKVGDGDV